MSLFRCRIPPGSRVAAERTDDCEQYRGTASSPDDQFPLSDGFLAKGRIFHDQPAYVERPAVQDAFSSISPYGNGAVICPAFMCGS